MKANQTNNLSSEMSNPTTSNESNDQDEPELVTIPLPIWEHVVRLARVGAKHAKTIGQNNSEKSGLLGIEDTNFPSLGLGQKSDEGMQPIIDALRSYKKKSLS